VEEVAQKFDSEIAGIMVLNVILNFSAYLFKFVFYFEEKPNAMLTV